MHVILAAIVFAAFVAMMFKGVDMVAGGYPPPLDGSLMFADGQTRATSGDSTNNVDAGAGYAPKPAAPMMLIFQPSGMAHGGQSEESYQINVQESDDAQSWTETGLSFPVTYATAEGAQLVKLFGQTKRYTKVVVTVGGTAPSITFTAWQIPFPT
jgi:hypothetical protein